MFVWDPQKAAANALKHGVTFDEAISVFRDRFEMTLPDRLHSEEEDRFVTIGYTDCGNLVAVCYTERGPLTRLISARKVTKNERRIYEQFG